MAVIEEATASGVSFALTNEQRELRRLAREFAEKEIRPKAAEYLQRCIPEYEMLGMETERARARWMLTHALVAAGRTHEAIPMLRKTWREFGQLELVADA